MGSQRVDLKVEADDAERKSYAEALIPQFKLERVLNQDQLNRRISLLGAISNKPALMTIERGALPTEPAVVDELMSRLVNTKNLQWNDIYHWYLSNISHRSSSINSSKIPADLKLNLIYPCTPQHVNKYSSQRVRMVMETSEIYHKYIRPYMSAYRAEGRLNWVFNILEGRTEQEDVILRHEPGPDDEKDEGFLLLPDMNWDRSTITSLRLLALVQRRDIWSLRDLKKKHVTWLRKMRSMILESVVSVYGPNTSKGGAGGVEQDELKLYVHYQPTYFHFHVHVFHAMCEAGNTQSVGKAVGLDAIVSQLETMAGDEETGMDSVTLSYYLGERSEIWGKVFGPLKKHEQPMVGDN